MKAVPDPPVEWVRGSWIGFAWVFGSAVALAIVLLIPLLQSVGWVHFLPFSLSQGPLYSQAAELGVAFVNIPALWYLPLNLRIGLTPEALIVRLPFTTRQYLWYQSWQIAPTVLRDTPYWQIYAQRVRLTRRQASRVAAFLNPVLR
jgi:hypothetical protein